ncbi:polysaccharide biosynthesis PFTS motif protein [Deltaproteobacteria bacterium TL4]
MNLIFESFQSWHVIILLLNLYRRKKCNIYIMDSYPAIHHQDTFNLNHSFLSKLTKKLLTYYNFSYLEPKKIQAEKIFTISNDKAVDLVESIYPRYELDHKSIIQFAVKVTQSENVKNLFKKRLCERLACFFSVNILMESIIKYFPNEKCLVDPVVDIIEYEYIARLLKAEGCSVFESDLVQFPKYLFIVSFIKKLKQWSLLFIKVLAQTLASCVFKTQHSIPPTASRKIGINLVGPRQLQDASRSATFFIDNKTLQFKDCLVITKMDVSILYQQSLTDKGGAIYRLPKRYFGYKEKWLSLLFLNLSGCYEELFLTSKIIFYYFLWFDLVQKLSLKLYVTHCDFSDTGIIRNLGFNKFNIQTWYFTDSINSGFPQQSTTQRFRHPFWSYLGYDHLVTWSQGVANYHKSHPSSFENIHVIGCLWSSLVSKKQFVSETNNKSLKNSFMIGVFDSSYIKNAVSDFKDAILFVQHISMLLEDFPDVHVIFKEKKARSFHQLVADAEDADTLNSLLKKLDDHPRATLNIFASDGMDSSSGSKQGASDLMDTCNFVISFPFTSTTFEFLSLNRPAIWHSPKADVRDKLFAKAGFVTHGYLELKQMVENIKRNPGYLDKNITANPELLDPFRDGKALERFQKLLFESMTVHD